MASIDRADPVIMGHILSQHRELHTQLTAVRACLAAAAPVSADRLAPLRDTLGTLRDYLRTHFALEEKGGFLEESIARMPRLSAAAQAVMGEHPALLAEIDGLIGRLDKPDSAATHDLLAADCERFVRHLLDHERNENAVVQEGYNEDLGLD